jgi:hypothetical protein
VNIVKDRMKKLFIVLLGAVCLVVGSAVVNTHVVNNTAVANPDC